MERTAAVKRNTRETDISVALTLDGTGESDINTGIGFFDHMLTLFARHGFFNLTVKCKGDTDVDYHHSVEDVGITLGQAFLKALGDKTGIARYGHSYGMDKVPASYAQSFYKTAAAFLYLLGIKWLYLAQILYQEVEYYLKFSPP